MGVRTIYSNQRGPGGRPAVNAKGCSIAVGVGSDNQLAFSVYGYGGADAAERGHHAFAIVDRAEARAIYEALGRELADG